jgi:hypothetical protein
VAGKPAKPRNPEPSIRLFLPLAVPFAILIALAIFAVVTQKAPAGAPAPGSRGALVWGDGLFARTPEMRAWLVLHNGSYRAWAKQHPAALHLLRPKPKLTARQRAQVKAKAKARAKASAEASPGAGG